MKKTIALVLAAMMLMTLLLSGCGDSSESSKASTGSATTGDAANVDPNNPYANLDTSEEVNLIMYSVADEPLDMDEILEMANERIKSALNATLELYFIPSAEYSVKYPLVLAGGDQVDLIYTANFRDYRNNVEKSSFLELTPEFLQTNMPRLGQLCRSLPGRRPMWMAKSTWFPVILRKFSRTAARLSTWTLPRNMALPQTISKPMMTSKNCCWPSAIKSLATACMPTISPPLPTSRNWDGDTVLT